VGKPVAKIAVTGGAGSGKSTVCEIFKRFGLIIYNADRFARDVVEINTPAYRKIVDYFGKGVLNRNRSLDRKALRKIITRDDSSKKALERIVHPEVLRMMREKLDEAAGLGISVVMEVPLLFELGLEKYFDFSVMVFSDRESKIGRLEKRDGVDEEFAAALIDLQMPDLQKLERADFVIDNSGLLENLEGKVQKVYSLIFNSI
jgi:dephospho-CoA kinase